MQTQKARLASSGYQGKMLLFSFAGQHQCPAVDDVLVVAIHLIGSKS
jgi:hypothetical protein